MRYAVVDGNFVFDLYNFDLCDFFQEHNPGTEWDLPVFMYQELMHFLHTLM